MANPTLGTPELQSGIDIDAFTKRADEQLAKRLSPQNKDDLKTMLAQKSGVAKEDITPKRLMDVKRVADVVNSGVKDPNQVIQKAGLEDQDPEDLYKTNAIAKSLLSAVPVALGYALGGLEGGAAGAKIGAESAAKYEQGTEEEARRREARMIAKAEKEAKAQETADERAWREAQAAKAQEYDIEKIKLSAEEQKKLAAMKAKQEKDMMIAQANLAPKVTKAEFAALPIQNQELIKDLAKKNTTKLSIANQIDQTVKVFDDPTVSKDLKVAMGQQLLKTLNSAEGADAVGAEESKRLGSALEFKMFNVTKPGSMFGRDLDLFRDQAAMTSNAIKQGIMANQDQIHVASRGEPMQLQQTPLLTQRQAVITSPNQAVAAPMPSVLKDPRQMTPEEKLKIMGF